jgi:activating signal cointegrator complex subunit 2
MGTLPPLPIYPSTQARKGFSASQLAQFHSNLSNALTQVISLPPAKQDTPSTRAFVSSFASDAAQQILETLIWKDTQPVKHDDRLRQRVLLLAQTVASSSPGLELRTLHDLCVAFPFKTTHLRSILSAALNGTPDLPATFASEVVPAFTSLLSPSRSSGLYGLRKTARCLTSLLRPSPPHLVRPFAHSREFMIALARAYDGGLAAISRLYGGIRIDVTNRKPDDWERIWLDTKVDIVDAFHLIVTTMVQDIETASETELAVNADRTCGIVFALLAITPQSVAVGPADAVPFLNRPLVADYQYAYDLSRTLSSAFRHASRDDTKLLESTLRSLDVERSGGDAKDPGALKLILRSSGLVPGASNNAILNPRPISIDKGKAKAIVPKSTPPHDADLDLQVSQVLDIFPDHSPEYIRKLLTHPSFPFRGNAERVIEALLEGTTPSEDALGDGVAEGFSIIVPTTDAPIERKNVFDQEVMDLTRVRVGKKTYVIEGLLLAFLWDADISHIG